MTKIEIDSPKAHYMADVEITVNGGDGISVTFGLDEEHAKELRNEITTELLGQELPEDWK